MIEEIIRLNEARISSDVEQLDDIVCIDFIDIFPKSEKHKEELDREAFEIASLIDMTQKGNFYAFKNPVKTKWGELKLFKIRVFDPSKLNWEAATDFIVKDFNEFKEKIQTDKRSRYVVRPNFCAVEYKTEKSLLYMLDIPTSKFYRTD